MSSSDKNTDLPPLPALSTKATKGITSILSVLKAQNDNNTNNTNNNNTNNTNNTKLLTSEEVNSLVNLRFKNGDMILSLEERWFVYEIVWILTSKGYDIT